MKKTLVMFVILLSMSTIAMAQDVVRPVPPPTPMAGGAIVGNVVEFESGNPLSSESWPYIQVVLEQNVGGQLQQVAGTDCWTNYNACAGGSGMFRISSTWDGKQLSGRYVIKVYSWFHMMVSQTVEVGARDLNLGDIVLHRQPAGFYITSVEQTPDGNSVVKGRAFRSVTGPAPALVARLTYSGPAVTVAYVNFDVTKQSVIWESEYVSTEMAFVLPIHAKVADGSTFTGIISLERADSSFHKYAEAYFVGVKGIPDFIGW